MPTTSTDLRPPAGDEDQPDCAGSARRARRRWRPGSTSRHHLALAVVLVALIPVAGIGGVWSADEGALLHQAASVGSGRGWTFPHPFPAADPQGGWFPIHLSAFAVDGGYVVLGKHVAFVHLTALLHRLGGYPAVLLLSAGSALAAASAGSRLAGRSDRRAALPALWLTGVASPLFISAYVAWAHTLAAALVGWALVGLTAGSEAALAADPAAGRPRPGRPASGAPALLGALALGAACLLRTEAGLAAIAVTLALATGAALERDRRRWPPVLAGLATVAGLAADRLTAVPVLGPVDPPEPGDKWGGLPGRLEGFSHTWLAPDFSARPEHLLLLLSAGAVIGAGVTARTRGASDRRVLALVAVAAMAVVIRFAISPVALIPGLVVAFPLLFAGLALLDRSDLARPGVRTLALAVTRYWGAVLATQYRHGGGGEWGGRYFALGLPAAVAMASVALVRAIEPVRGADRRRLLGLGALVTLLPVAMGILGLRDSRAQTRAITDRVDAALAAPGDGTGVPIVVTTLAPLGRWAWDDVDRSRWLLVPAEELALVGPRLSDLSVDRFLFVSDRSVEQLPDLEPWFIPVEPLDPEAGSTLDRVIVPVRAATPER